MYEIELTYAGQNISISSTEISMFNERQKVEINLKKHMEINKEYNIGNNNELEKVNFGLYANEKIIAQNGSFIPEDGLIEIIAINKEGVGTVKTDLPMRKILFKRIFYK